VNAYSDRAETDTHKGLIKAHPHTNFGYNLIKIYGVIIDFSHKKVKGLSCLQGKLLEEKKTWPVDGVTIVGVPFCGLKGVRKKTTVI